MTKPKVSARLRAKYGPPPQMPDGQMRGTRLPDFIHETGHEYFRLDRPVPGGFVLCRAMDGEESWWGCDPLGHWLVFPAHAQIVVGEVGMITVYDATVPDPSPDPLSARSVVGPRPLLIENHTPGAEAWKGYLVDGIWHAGEF